MTRGKKVSRFLIGATLIVGGVLAWFVSGKPVMSYVVGGIITFIGFIFMSDKSGKTPGFLTLLIGLLIVGDTFLKLGYLPYVAILSLLTGGFLSYDTHKKINSY